MRVSHIFTDENIVINFKGQTHIVSKTDSNANKIIEKLRSKQYDGLEELVSISKKIENFSNGNFLVKDGQIFINNVAVPEVLSKKILEFSNTNLPYEPLVKFAENLQNNPSFRALNELYQFLEKNNHPITDNGCFIAYKKVLPNFKDIRTGTMDNSVGTTVEMPRNKVDEDPNRTCSHGLHVSNWDYAYNHYGSSTDIMLEVEVNPADVVAVPVDYNQSKMRVCKYKVLGVVDKESSSTTLRYTQQNNTSNCESDCDDSCDESDEDYCTECEELCVNCYCADEEKEEDDCDDLEEEEEEEESNLDINYKQCKRPSNAKFTDKQVNDIRNLFLKGVSVKKLASSNNVSIRCMQRLVNNESYYDNNYEKLLLNKLLEDESKYEDDCE